MAGRRHLLSWNCKLGYHHDGTLRKSPDRDQLFFDASSRCVTWPLCMHFWFYPELFLLPVPQNTAHISVGYDCPGPIPMGGLGILTRASSERLSVGPARLFTVSDPAYHPDRGHYGRVRRLVP